MGYSELVAAKHYLQLTDEHFIRATSEEAAQKLHETTRNTPKQHSVADDEREASSCRDDNLQLISADFGSEPMPVEGLKPTSGVNRNGF